jgi:dTMP kinase
MNQRKHRKGMLIAVEGIDGAGKTTQVQLLKEHLSSLGYDVAAFKEPTDGVFGQKIREIAQKGRAGVSAEEEFQLFLKDRIEDVQKNLQPSLEQDLIVIMDRYYFSNIAYQGALGMDMEYIKQENEKIAPIPDIVFILDIPPDVGLKRIKHLRGETPNTFEEKEYLKKVRNIFKTIATQHPHVHIINAEKPIQEIHKTITTTTLKILQHT